VYAREVDGQTLSFGVSGMLWRDNLVMYDRQTDSWWSQADGKAIRGPRQGTQLVQLPSDLMRFAEWRALHPKTLVLSTGERPGRDRYLTYHEGRDIGVTGRTRSAGALDAKARVVGIRLGGRAFAVDLDRLKDRPVLHADAGGQAVVAVLGPDGETARVFLAAGHQFTAVATTDGRRTMQDAATRSTWDAFGGTAVTGRLAGAKLEQVTAHLSYWFSWHSFFPDTTLLGAGQR
jgi:hypothetical protein